MRFRFVMGTLGAIALSASSAVAAFFADNQIARVGGIFGLGGGLLIIFNLWGEYRIQKIKDERIKLLTERAETAEYALLHLGSAIVQRSEARLDARWPNHTQN